MSSNIDSFFSFFAKRFHVCATVKKNSVEINGFQWAVAFARSTVSAGFQVYGHLSEFSNFHARTRGFPESQTSVNGTRGCTLLLALGWIAFRNVDLHLVLWRNNQGDGRRQWWRQLCFLGSWSEYLLKYLLFLGGVLCFLSFHVFFFCFNPATVPFGVVNFFLNQVER